MTEIKEKKGTGQKWLEKNTEKESSIPKERKGQVKAQRGQSGETKKSPKNTA